MPNLMLPKSASDEDRIELLALIDPEDTQAASAALRLPEHEALAFIEMHDAEITAARIRLEQTGGTLELLARRFAVNVLTRFNTDLDTLDTMEAADLLKHALRIIENADRVKQATIDPFAHLPMTNIVIHLNPANEPTGITIDAEEVGGK